jgi:cytochrome P450
MTGITNVFAGSDTTAVSFSSILYYLLTTSQTLKNLRQEMKDHNVRDRRTTFKASQKMPYLQALLREGLRMHSATGLPLWRVVSEGGLKIGDDRLPSGSNLGVDSWVAYYNKSIFGDDTHVFRPER